MGRFLKITLDDKQRAALEQGYRNGKTHTSRQHCQIVSLLGCNPKCVNDWVHRYQKEGIHGLHIKSGRARKSILSQATDSAKVRQAVKRHRQRIKLAKAELESSLGKEFSQPTLVRFLKNLTADTNP